MMRFAIFRRRNNRPSRRITVLGLALAAAAWAGGASAMPSCEGSYVAASLHPLPAKIVVGLEIRDPSPVNKMLADRFLDGIRAAGVMVGAPATVVLRVNASRIGGEAAGSGGSTPLDVTKMPGLTGGVHLALPAMPETSVSKPSTASAPSILLLRVEATVPPATNVAWLVAVQCRANGTDDGMRAEDLGRMTGGALGRRIERQPF